MKSLYLILFALCLFASCKKEHPVISDSGCISRVKSLNYHIKSADSAAAMQLLLQYHLPTDLSFNLISMHDSLADPDGTMHYYRYVIGTQFVNGVQILSDYLAYTFKDGVYLRTTGRRYNSVNLDTVHRSSLQTLRNLYMAGIRNTNSATVAAGFKDTCLVARFGYYDLNAAIDTDVPNFVKAWAVSPKNALYPLGIFRDDNGGTIVMTPPLPK